MKLERRALQILGLCKLVEIFLSVTGGDCYCTELKAGKWEVFRVAGEKLERNRKKHVLFLRKK